jgi:type VI secretion system ImpC/EvpB family protein
VNDVGEIALDEAVYEGAAATDGRSPPAAPLREAVLAGAFFGHRHLDAAAQTAEFITLPAAAACRSWFGDAAAAHLARDRAELTAALDRDIATIDSLIGEQLDAVLHDARMRRFEGNWRGLHWLVRGMEPEGRVKVKVLNISWLELCRDLERAIEFDQSQLFRKIYEDEFGSPGGEPYGLLVVDHEVRHRPSAGALTDDVTAIAQLAAVAAAAFAPTVLSASPALLQVEEFADLAMTNDLGDPFRGPEFARWRSLSTREEMRFIAIVLPRILARPPWEDDPGRPDGFRYAEYVPERASRVWMTAGYAFAAVAARAFTDFAWPASVRGSETDFVGGGLVNNLPIEPFRTDPDHVWVRPPLDIVLTDHIEGALVEAGLMPLSMLPYGEEAVFSATRSLQAPRRHIGPTAEAADANARLSTQLNSMLCVSRFAHYVKVIGRDMVGSFKTGDEIERRLQGWINGYVNGSITAGPENRARYPLVAAQATVREQPGRPGVFSCTMLLQPHFQLDDVATSFRLVTEITAPGVRT